MKDDKDEHPPEGLLLFLMMAITLGGTLFVNWILWLFIPGLYG